MRYNEAMHELGTWDEAMVQKEFLPAAVLSPYIKSHQLLTGQNRVRHLAPWYLLPDNSVHMIFYLYEKSGQLLPSLRIVGPRTVHKFISRARRRLTFISTFRPGGFSSFCQCPLVELADQAFDAENFLRGLNDVHLECMRKAAIEKNIKELIALQEKLLLLHLNPDVQASRLVQNFQNIEQRPLIKVSEMAAQLGLSERHLRSLAYRYIGHAPKEILQISRFTHSLLLSNLHREWSAIAVDAGYYDQSHMIAAYQRMCGSSPEKLFGS